MSASQTAGSELLARLQEGLPLVRRPFAAIGEELGLGEDEVISFLNGLSSEGKVRRFGGVFDARRLGCRTALAAVAVDGSDIDRVASLLTPLSGVTHCYRREITKTEGLSPDFQGLSPETGGADFQGLSPKNRAEIQGLSPETGGEKQGLSPNLWFTISYPADVFPAMVDAIRSRLEGYEMLLLPALRRFKVDVVFSEQTRQEEEKTEFPSNFADFSNYPSKIQGLSPFSAVEKQGLSPNFKGLSPKEEGGCPQVWRPTAGEMRIGSVMQGDTEIRADYWAGVAEKAGVKEWELLSTLEIWRRAGRLKRVGLLLSHRNAGWKANGMCCWRVEGDGVVSAGRALAAMPEVTHCYERPLAQSFGYNLFAMIHSKTLEGASEIFSRISQAAGLEGGVMLLSVHEYKKTSLRFFPVENYTVNPLGNIV